MYQSQYIYNIVICIDLKSWLLSLKKKDEKEQDITLLSLWNTFLKTKNTNPNLDASLKSACWELGLGMVCWEVQSPQQVEPDEGKLGHWRHFYKGTVGPQSVLLCSWQEVIRFWSIICPCNCMVFCHKFKAVRSAGHGLEPPRLWVRTNLLCFLTWLLRVFC